MKKMILLCFTLAMLAVDVNNLAVAGGGPWVNKPGQFSFTFGFSRKTAGKLWRNGKLEEPADSTLVDGLFHDFQYAYFQPEIGLMENLSLSGNFLYLWGYERVQSDPKTGKPVKPHWELNHGFTDMWLNLKYQFLQGDFPMAVQVSSRFPDLYDEEGPYSRYIMRVTTRDEAVKVDDTTFKRVTYRDTTVAASSEWRGLLKRDLGIHLLAGHSFDGNGYAQAELAYNFRQDAYADQVIFRADGGYNVWQGDGFTLMPKLSFDYTAGVGNGTVPDSTDRFYFKTMQAVPGTPVQANLPTANYYFNDGNYGRLYGSLSLMYDKYAIELGGGRWLFGDGAPVYTELYAQVGVTF